MFGTSNLVSRFSRQSRPSRLSQALTIAAEAHETALDASPIAGEQGQNGYQQAAGTLVGYD